ncbi:MAG: hypothetical protein ACRDLD_06335 [Thermoleophilaceae bacterium]
MPRSQRIALVAGALVVAVIAFLIAQPGDDEEAERSATTTPAQTSRERDEPTETRPQAEDEEEPAPAPPPEPQPQVTRIRLQDGAVAGGAKDIEVEPGETVRIVVTADAPDEIHLHGYDITKDAAPGRPARFRFEAKLEGAFEMESHAAEDAGRDPLVARLVVSPS